MRYYYLQYLIEEFKVETVSEKWSALWLVIILKNRVKEC